MPGQKSNRSVALIIMNICIPKQSLCCLKVHFYKYVKTFRLEGWVKSIIITLL